MSILLTVWLAGMPPALVFLMWSMKDVPRDEDNFLTSWDGLATAAIFVIGWPVFLFFLLRDLWRGK